MQLPYFVIAGAQKCGTTALVSNMQQHPAVYFPGKELHFFDMHWDRGVAWYVRQFNGSRGRVCGEKTPGYMLHRTHIARMHTVLPQVKLIMVLRNPIDRCYSQYQLARRGGSAKGRSFREFINEELPDVDKELTLRGELDCIRRGLYAKQLKVLTEFYPREQQLIIVNERMRIDSARTTNDVFAWLGLAGCKLPHTRNYRRKYPPMRAKMRQRLADVYREPNDQLFEFLGYRIEEWDD